jgi:hypothetical protein
MLVGSSIALLAWPFEPAFDDGAAARYPRAFATVGSIYVLAPLLIGAGSSTVTWAYSYSRFRVEIQPTLGGLRLRF